MEFTGSPESRLSVSSKMSIGTTNLSSLSPDTIEDRQYDEERIFRELTPINFELPINKDYNIDEIFGKINKNNNENNNKNPGRGNIKKSLNKKPTLPYSKILSKENLEDKETNFYTFKEESICNIY